MARVFAKASVNNYHLYCSHYIVFMLHTYWRDQLLYLPDHDKRPHQSVSANYGITLSVIIEGSHRDVTVAILTERTI